MKCSACLENLLWGGDHDYEDYGHEGDGIVGNYSCQNEDCNVDMVIIYTNNEAN